MCSHLKQHECTLKTAYKKEISYRNRDKTSEVMFKNINTSRKRREKTKPIPTHITLDM